MGSSMTMWGAKQANSVKFCLFLMANELGKILLIEGPHEGVSQDRLFPIGKQEPLHHPPPKGSLALEHACGEGHLLLLCAARNLEHLMDLFDPSLTSIGSATPLKDGGRIFFHC